MVTGSGTTDASRPWRVPLAWAVFAATVLLFATGLTTAVLNAADLADFTVAGAVFGQSFFLTMMSFSVAGLFITLRQPRNAIGWLLLAIGLVWQLGNDDIVRYIMITEPDLVPAADVITSIVSTSWVWGIGLIGTSLLLLFPDGRLPSPRWRVVLWASGLSLTVVSLLIVGTPGSLKETAYPFLPDDRLNPLGVPALAEVSGPLQFGVLLLPISIVLSAAGMIVRFRRSHGRERRQLEWLAWSGSVIAAAYLVVMVMSAVYGGSWGDEDSPALLRFGQVAVIYVLVLVPVSIGIAVLRHQLWDIDVIINRTVVYSLLTVSLAAVYVGGVLGAGALLRAISGQERGGLAVAVSTLAVAALFAPLRRRIQAAVDRRFYRSRFDAQVEVGRFARRMRDPVELPELQGDLVTTVASTIQPVGAAVWLRPAERG